MFKIQYNTESTKTLIRFNISQLIRITSIDKIIKRTLLKHKILHKANSLLFFNVSRKRKNSICNANLAF
jgi:hypothetical protein